MSKNMLFKKYYPHYREEIQISSSLLFKLEILVTPKSFRKTPWLIFNTKCFKYFAFDSFYRIFQINTNFVTSWKFFSYKSLEKSFQFVMRNWKFFFTKSIFNDQKILFVFFDHQYVSILLIISKVQTVTFRKILDFFSTIFKSISLLIIKMLAVNIPHLFFYNLLTYWD